MQALQGPHMWGILGAMWADVAGSQIAAWLQVLQKKVEVRDSKTLFVQDHNSQNSRNI